MTKKGVVKAKKAGKAAIKVTVKYKKGKTVKTSVLKCKVTVTKKGNTAQEGGSSPSPTPNGGGAVSPSQQPTATPSVTPNGSGAAN